MVHHNGDPRQEVVESLNSFYFCISCCLSSSLLSGCCPFKTGAANSFLTFKVSLVSHRDTTLASVLKIRS